MPRKRLTQSCQSLGQVNDITFPFSLLNSLPINVSQILTQIKRSAAGTRGPSGRAWATGGH
jgi:hypothetical protein